MKDAGRIGLALLGPIMTATLLAALARLLHATGWTNVAIYVGEIAGALLIIRWLRKRTDIAFGLRPIYSWFNGLWSMLYTSVRVAAWLLIIPQVRIETNWHILIAQSAFFLLLNSVGEELHFRSLLFGTLRTGKWPHALLIAAFITSILFALAHLIALSSSGWIWLLLFIGDGLALCAIRIKTGSIYWSVLVHGLLNIGTGVLFIGPKEAADSVVLTYIVAVVIIDLLFFIFAINQAKPRLLEAKETSGISYVAE